MCLGSTELSSTSLFLSLFSTALHSGQPPESNDVASASLTEANKSTAFDMWVTKYIKRIKSWYQCVQVKLKYFSNQNHLFGCRMLLCCASNNDDRIVDKHPSKFNMRIWFWHRRQDFPLHLVIQHVDIIIYNLKQQKLRAVLKALLIEQKGHKGTAFGKKKERRLLRHSNYPILRWQPQRHFSH